MVGGGGVTGRGEEGRRDEKSAGAPVECPKKWKTPRCAMREEARVKSLVN